MCLPWWILEKLQALLPSKSTQQQHIQRLEEGWLIIDNMEIGNIFNKHFIDGVAAHSPILSEHAFANRLSVHKISRRRNHLQLSFLHVAKSKYAWNTSRNLYQSSLMLHSTFNLLYSFWKCFYSFNSSYNIILSLLVTNRIQETWKRRRETWRRRAEEIAYVDQNNRRTESITLTGNSSLYMFFSTWRRFLPTEHSAMIQTSRFISRLYWFFEFGGVCQRLAFLGHVHL